MLWVQPPSINSRAQNGRFAYLGLNVIGRTFQTVNQSLPAPSDGTDCTLVRTLTATKPQSYRRSSGNGVANASGSFRVNQSFRPVLGVRGAMERMKYNAADIGVL